MTSLEAVPESNANQSVLANVRSNTHLLDEADNCTFHRRHIP
jgi:hypothetical protein